MWSTASPWTLFNTRSDASESTLRRDTPITSHGRITPISETEQSGTHVLSGRKAQSLSSTPITMRSSEPGFSIT